MAEHNALRAKAQEMRDAAESPHEVILRLYLRQGADVLDEAQATLALETQQRQEAEQALADFKLYNAELSTLSKQLAAADQARAEAEQQLLHWKTCSLCGEVMTAPGHCDSAESERVKGLEQMHEETLDRAELAETAAAQWRDKLAAVMVEKAEAEQRVRALIAKWRASVAQVRNSAIEPAIGNVLEQCADELEATLTPAPTPRGAVAP